MMAAAERPDYVSELSLTIAYFGKYLREKRNVHQNSNQNLFFFQSNFGMLNSLYIFQSLMCQIKPEKVK